MPKSDDFLLPFRYSKDDTYARNYIEGIKKKRKFPNRNIALKTICQEHEQSKEFQDKILKQSKTMLGQTSSQTLIPEGCRSCSLVGLVIEIKGQPMMVCILRKENKQPIIKYRSIDEAKVCSLKPTYISKATQKEYERQLEILGIQLDREEEKVTRLEKKDAYYEELRKTVIQKDQDNKTLESYEKDLEKKLKQAKRQLKPMESLIMEKEKLESKVSEMGNALLERDDTIATLNMNVDYLNGIIEERSEDKVFEENQLLKVKLGQAKQQIGDYVEEIKKLDALIEKERLQKNELIMKVSQKLIDLKRYAPASLERYELTTYLRNVRKTIENFEGYLNTIRV